MLRESPTPTADRSSVLIELRLIDKLNLPVDASVAWTALLLAFKDHPHLQVKSVKVSPDKRDDNLV